MNLVIRIKKWRQSEGVVLFILMLTFCFGTLIDLLGLPNAVKYVIDILWLFLLLTMAINKFRMPSIETRGLLVCFSVLLVIALLGFILNIQSVLYFLWGFRNNFRFFIYFFSCIMFLREESADKVLQLFNKIFYFNFLVVLIQFLLLDKRQDFLGGVFGVEAGCNANLLIFMCIVVSRNILGYLNRTEKASTCLVICLISLLIAAWAELKFYYVLFIAIVAMAMLMTNNAQRIIPVVVFSIIGIYIGINVLERVFDSWTDWFNLGNMIKIATSSRGYTGRGDMNRLTGISIAWERFLPTWSKRLFGLGLGNCDTSVYSFLNTPFYRRYGYLHYNWFSAPFMFLEMGILGLSCYICYFVLIYVYTHKKQNEGRCRREWAQLTKMMAIVSLLLIVYNSSMRIEYAYMMYFVLALPFLKDRKNIPQTNDKTDFSKEVMLWN